MTFFYSIIRGELYDRDNGEPVEQVIWGPGVDVSDKISQS